MWILLVFLFAQVSMASSFADMYTRGSLSDIAAQAEVAETAADLVWVARAANTEAQFVHTSGKAFENAIHRAITASERAIQLDPDNWEATLELARALGYRALTQGILQNITLAPRIKGLLEQVVELDPGNPDGLIALARMHQQLDASGAGWLYGAQPSIVVPYTEQGLSAAPNRIGIQNEAALIARDIPDKEWACKLLAAAKKLVPTSWIEGQESTRTAVLQREMGCV